MLLLLLLLHQGTITSERQSCQAPEDIPIPFRGETQRNKIEREKSSEE